MRTPAGDVRSKSEVVLWPGLPVGEAVRRRLETEVSTPVGEVGWSWKTGAAPSRPDLLVGDWIVLLACYSDTWPAHELRVVCLGQAFIGKPVREGPRVYEPDTITV